MLLKRVDRYIYCSYSSIQRTNSGNSKMMYDVLCLIPWKIVKPCLNSALEYKLLNTTDTVQSKYDWLLPVKKVEVAESLKT